MATITTDEAQDFILDTLTLGFSSDPVMRWLYPSPSSYLEHFPETLKLFGGSAFSNKTALSAGNGAAAALWLHIALRCTRLGRNR